MAEIKASIVIAGVVGLSMIGMCMVIFDHIDDTIVTAIVAAIALAIGVVIPSPKADNRSGVLKW